MIDYFRLYVVIAMMIPLTACNHTSGTSILKVSIFLGILIVIIAVIASKYLTAIRNNLEKKKIHLLMNDEEVRRNFEAGAGELLPLIQQENAIAQFDLGLKYQIGENIGQNYEAAFYWYIKSAEQGYIPAQTNLSYLYINGLGSSKNFSQAHYWLYKAANAGDAQAQNNIAGMYLNGMGVKTDKEAGRYWLTKAAAQGNEQASYNLALLDEKRL